MITQCFTDLVFPDVWTRPAPVWFFRIGMHSGRVKQKDGLLGFQGIGINWFSWIRLVFQILDIGSFNRILGLSVYIELIIQSCWAPYNNIYAQRLAGVGKKANIFFAIENQ